MTGTPEDAEKAAWHNWNRWGESVTQTPMIREAHRAGFAAARPPVTVDEITELLDGHLHASVSFTPRTSCTCGWSEVLPPATTSGAHHRRHQASVIVAHITGEGA